MSPSRDERPEDDLRLVGVLRRVSGARPSDAAVDRIAEGAWQRAGGPARARGVRTPRRLTFLRPIGLAAAVLVLGTVIGTSLIPESALAVEGDPVKIWDGDSWERRSKVRPGSWVYTPVGSRHVRFDDGSKLLPQPGTVFRVERLAEAVRASGLPFRVEVPEGSVEYDGDPLALTISDVDVTPKSLDRALRLSVEISEGLDAPPASPAGFARVVVGAPRVHVFAGSVVVRARSSGETLELGDAEAATLFAGADAAKPARLTRLRAWSPAVLSDVLKGHVVTDALPSGKGGMRVLLGGPRFETVEIPAEHRARAIASLNEAMNAIVPLLNDMKFEMHVSTTREVRLPDGTRSSDVAVHIEGLADLLEPTPYEPVELTFEKGDRRVHLSVDGDGRCLLRDGQAVRVYVSVAQFRAQHPDLAELFAPDLRPANR